MSELYELTLRKDIKNRFLVTGVRPYFTYRDGKRTDAIEGYKYEVLPLSDKTVGVCTIKVPGQPAISTDAVLKNDIIVSFENITFTPYYSKATGKREVSIKADKIMKAEKSSTER